jgi:putative ABC transport system permease protein
MGRLALRWLIVGDWCAHPARIFMAIVAIGIGVALGFAVHLVNGSALSAFGGAIRSLNGAADLQVKATSPLGFDEAIYRQVARIDGIADASPVVEMKALDANGSSFTLLGLDVLRAGHVTPALVGQNRDNLSNLSGSIFSENSILLSQSVLQTAAKKIGDRIAINANGKSVDFQIAGTLPALDDRQRIAVIDIAAAQTIFFRLGQIDRIDLQLSKANDVAKVRQVIAAILPQTALLNDNQDEIVRGDAISRAYRVNLDMLALVALLTGTFLVYSTLSLSVTRRLQSFALLSTLGMRKSHISRLVAIEGVVAGIIGSTLGLFAGYALAAIAMRFMGGDLGGGYFDGVAPTLVFSPGAAMVFFGLGVLAALCGSTLPAIQGARVRPAVALKNAGDAVDPRQKRSIWLSLILAACAALAAIMPPVHNISVFGYISIALLLGAGIAAMSSVSRLLLAPLVKRNIGNFPASLAVQHLYGAPGSASNALYGIVASTALMIAMAVMVTSFRSAVDQWLGDVLTGDLYLRADPGSGGFSTEDQELLKQVPGVREITFSRQIPLTIAADKPPVTLITRPIGKDHERLKIISGPVDEDTGTIPIWFSEPAALILHKNVGDVVQLPIGKDQKFTIVGIWRDYARQQGAVVIDAQDYIRLTNDAMRDEASVTLEGGAKVEVVGQALIKTVSTALQPFIQTSQPATLRQFALTLFDRSFAITYVLEAIAIIVGLAGVAATTSAQAISRSREFGMLRHIGVSKAQIIKMLAIEGAVLGAIGGVAGVALGSIMSQVLIHVVNPQSFNWTMTTRFPIALMISVVISLVLSASITAVLAGRRAVSINAVKAVRADW